jgi:hypothetical protein
MSKIPYEAATRTAGDAKSSAESLVKRARDTVAATNRGLLAIAAALYLLWVSGIEPAGGTLVSALRERKAMVTFNSQRDRYAKALGEKKKGVRGPNVTVDKRVYLQPVVQRRIASAKVRQGQLALSLAGYNRFADVSVKLGPIDLTVPLLFAPLLWLAIFTVALLWLLMARYEIIRLIGRSRRLCPELEQTPITSRQLDDHPFWAHPLRFKDPASAQEEVRLLFGATHHHWRDHAIGIAIAVIATLSLGRVTDLAFHFARVFANGGFRQGLQAATLALLGAIALLLVAWMRPRRIPQYLPDEPPPSFGVTRRQAVTMLGMAAIAAGAPTGYALERRIVRHTPRFRHWPPAALLFEPADLDVERMTAWFDMTDGPLASLIRREVTSPVSDDGRKINVAFCRELNRLVATQPALITRFGGARASRETRHLAEQKLDENGVLRLARLVLADNFPRAFPRPHRRRERVRKHPRFQGLALDRLR